MAIVCKIPEQVHTNFHRILDMYVPFAVVVVVTMNITILRDKFPLPWLQRNLQLPSFSLSSRSVHDPPTVRPGTYLTGGWVGPSAGVDERKVPSPPGFDPGPSSP